MNAARLKLFLLITWGMVILLGGMLALWALTSPEAAPIREIGANRPSATSPAIEISPSPSRIPPTARPTIVIATRRPVSPTPITPTPTPVTPLPTLNTNPDIAPPGVNPLTGLKVADPSLLERRPVAVKIVTFPRSSRKHQSGLTLADVVYEYYTENLETRFIAVFYGNDAEKAGPVRSGRYFDEHIMRMYHSSLVFAKADDRVINYLLESDLEPLLFLPRSDNCPPLCDDPTIEGYNDYFVNTAGVGAFLSDNSRQPLRLTAFSKTINIFSGTENQRLYTFYSYQSYNYWEYDPAREMYLRYSDAADAQNGQPQYAPHIDTLTGQQLAADNVVVLVVPHNFKNEYDRADQVFDIDLTGSGDAYVFRAGRMYKATWSRNEIDQPIRLFNADGKILPLKAGVTFYQVINPESIVTQEDTTMNFRFFIPPRVLTPLPTATRFKPTPTPKK